MFKKRIKLGSLNRNNKPYKACIYGHCRDFLFWSGDKKGIFIPILYQAKGRSCCEALMICRNSQILNLLMVLFYNFKHSQCKKICRRIDFTFLIISTPPQKNFIINTFHNIYPRNHQESNFFYN